ncbi:MAG: hypothetical protein GWP91_06575, partial [Rhodobacterales bacterium]|nr:hypothetical protein [Rhodobacterales bacterium]
MTRLSALLAFLCFSQPAHAYPTRVHIALANDIRTELLASPDGRTLRLEGGDYIVRLPEDDARAVREWPLAFRAGAIGPDNFVFPAMTDLTHAVGLRPYDQCEDLYQLAETDQERAYAMGCFLHGSSDAVAHHYVNALTGETFTVNPISNNREEDFSNVVRHIVAEVMIQEAWQTAWPEAFTDEAMLHAIPKDFILRAVTHPDSPVWKQMTTHAVPKWEAIQAGMPDALMVEPAAALDVAPAEHLALIPLYVDRVHIDLDWAMSDIDALITDFQDPTSALGAELGVGPGPDGTVGTEDDSTNCIVTCITPYTTYFTLVALQAPIPDDSGALGPSALDTIAADLHFKLDKLLPAYVQSVSETSALLNEGIDPDNPGAEIADIDPIQAFAPLIEWSEDLTDLDWDLIVETVSPGWLLDLRDTLEIIGIYVDFGGIVEPLIQPRIDEIRDAIVGVVIEPAEGQIDELTTLIEEEEDAIRTEFVAELNRTAPSGVQGTLLDDLAHSGLYMHSFNMVAVTLADHQMVLPMADEHAGVGAATFDASYTLAWTQPVICGYQTAILPLGTDRAALLSLHIDGKDFLSTAEDSPVECH